jgi:hypothetical protein
VEVWEYVEGLSADLTEEQRIERAEAAISRLEGEARKAAAAQEAPMTRSQRSINKREVEVLSKRTDTLEEALRKGADTPIQRAARTAEVALEAEEHSIRLVAVKEKWTVERRDQLMSEKRGPVQELLKRAMESRRAAAIAKWTREVHKILPDAQEWAEEILEEKCTDYTLKEMDFFMQEFGTWNRQLNKLLVTGAAAGYAGQAAYEEESEELQETQHRMRQAQEWLSAIKSTLPDQDCRGLPGDAAEADHHPADGL